MVIEFIYKSLGHTEYRIQAKEDKKKSHAILNNDINNKGKKQPRVNWSASSDVIFRQGVE